MIAWSPAEDTSLVLRPFFPRFFPLPLPSSSLLLSSSSSFARAFSTRLRCLRSASSFSSYCARGWTGASGVRFELFGEGTARGEGRMVNKLVKVCRFSAFSLLRTSMARRKSSRRAARRLRRYSKSVRLRMMALRGERNQPPISLGSGEPCLIALATHVETARRRRIGRHDISTHLSSALEKIPRRSKSSRSGICSSSRYATVSAMPGFARLRRYAPGGAVAARRGRGAPVRCAWDLRRPSWAL